MIEDVERAIAAWHKQTFPNATLEAKRKKLLEECQELMAALIYGDIQHALEEVADVFIVSVSIANDRRNFEHDVTMTRIIEDKLAVNMSREWGEEDEEGDRPRHKVKPETFQYVQDHMHRYRVRQKNGEYSKFFDDFKLWPFINEEIEEHYALRYMNEC